MPHKEWTLEIGLEDRFELILFQFEERCAVEHGGIVDENVYSLICVECLGYEVVDVEPLADVALDEDGGLVPVGKLFSSTLAALFVNVSQHDLCAFSNEALCTGISYATCGTGDDRNLVLQVHEPRLPTRIHGGYCAPQRGARAASATTASIDNAMTILMMKCVRGARLRR